jgi:hypothetical protein
MSYSVFKVYRTPSTGKRSWTSPNCSRFRGQEQGIRPAPVIRFAADDPRAWRRAPINLPPMEHKDVHAMIYDIMNDTQRKVYEENLECDFSFAVPNLARFRVNAFVQNRGAGAVFRTIPSKILTLEDLKAPKIFKDTRRPAARPGAGHRADRLRQVDHAGGDGRPHQRKRVRPHPDRRGSDRIRA